MRKGKHSTIIHQTWQAISLAVVSLLVFGGCHKTPCQESGKTTEFVNDIRCEAPVAGQGQLFEVWNSENNRLHAYDHGLSIDVGSSENAKYLERKSSTPWLAPELVTPEIARQDKMEWASGRYTRWLGSTVATLHFPFYGEDWDGDLTVSVELRPKNNPSMAVRIYKPDGSGGRVWSDPLTTDLTPGWHGYRWQLPREYLSKDGMQLLRVSFPGSYFEGENRVSSKFATISISNRNAPLGKYKIEPLEHWSSVKPARVLDQSLPSYGIRTGNRLERFMVVPDKAMLRFYVAPSAWLEAPGKLTILAATDGQNPEPLAEIQVKPGDCWKLQTIPLENMAHQAARLSFVFQLEEEQQVFSGSHVFHPEVYISEPEIRVDDGGAYEKAHQMMAQAKRIVMIGIDNLRADRLWVESKRRATPVLSRMADEGILGVIMGEGQSYVSTTASFLTSVPADVHKVYAVGTHVREILTSVAEAAAPQGWKSHFYSTSGAIDFTRGFAQGFDTLHQLNKDDKLDAASALSDVGAAMSASEEKSMYYVHLSELRLPHRASEEKMELWGVSGYSGPVDMAAMQNVAVMRDPGPLDARQFEAYYDGELSSVDTAIGEFLSRIPDDTLVVVYGTHGTSLGESTLGYEQGLTPWELLMPFVFYMPGREIGIRREEIARASELSASVLDLIGAELPSEARTIFELHDSRPMAQTEGLAATSSFKDFYRIRREGVDILFTTGLDGNPAHENTSPLPITRQALREKID